VGSRNKAAAIYKITFGWGNRFMRDVGYKYFIATLCCAVQQLGTGDQQFATILMRHYSVLLPSVVSQEASREQHDCGNHFVALKWRAVAKSATSLLMQQ
jgi:hypothetical protein